MNKLTTCLRIGEIIKIPEAVINRVLIEFSNNTQLQLGHMVQYAHNQILIDNGWDIRPSKEKALYDRNIVGDVRLHEDKVATFETANGLISNHHTISGDEHTLYKRLLKEDIDTVIHSFEYIDRSYSAAIYRGAVSFALLYCAPDGAGLRTGKNSYFFDREAAYKWNNPQSWNLR